MFTGIIETLGEVVLLEEDKGNLHITIKSAIANELKIDQSVAHNGACLTVVKLQDDAYTVTAIDETLQKTNLNMLKQGDLINLERCMQLNARLDGHLVQGHVDQTAVCANVNELQGSWVYTFNYIESAEHIIVEKGSICVNGISLTAFNVANNQFSVAIIPYTYQHTNLKKISSGDLVNLEFDVIGKYVSRLAKYQV